MPRIDTNLRTKVSKPVMSPADEGAMRIVIALCEWVVQHDENPAAKAAARDGAINIRALAKCYEKPAKPTTTEPAEKPAK